MASIDIHIIQTVPPSNLNRDDNGSPKTAIYGGARRARVSSQAWKRATRLNYRKLLDQSDLGVRTKRVAELVAERIVAARPDTTDEQAVAGAWEVLTALKLKPEKARKDGGVPSSQYLVFFSNPQLDRLAELALANDLGKVAAKDAKVAVKQDHGVTLSLFGRMIADDADLNVDASVQVAHALSTHAVEPEYDFYTAVDDSNPEEETGAGMMGLIEFNSSTLYRYATISLDALHDNLGSAEAAARAVEAFVTGFTLSMPSGKQNTFANGTVPDAIVVLARPGQGVNLVGAFEDAVKPGNSGYIASSCEKLAKHHGDLVEAFGEHSDQSWVVRVGDRTSSLDSMGERVVFDELVAQVGSHVRETLQEKP